MRRGLVAVAVAALAGACTGGPAGLPPGSRTLDQMAREVGADVMEAVRRGHVPGRSGEIVLVPKPHHVVVRRGSWAPGEEPSPDTSHSTPWDYHQRIPIVLYGPGFVREGVVSDREADLADLAPTFAELMGFDGFDALDGAVLEEALLPERRGVPAVIVLVAYDGGGWNLLREYPDDWPFVRGLLDRATTFTNATVGSSPSVTAAVHPTMGTGAYPVRHGIPDNTVRLPGGAVGDAFLGRTDPGLLRVDSLADAWVPATGHTAWAGIVATESWHLGMLGRGSESHGVPTDVAVLWNRAERRFFTNPERYRLPPHLPGSQELDEHVRALDASDGAVDGRWMTNDLEDPDVLPGTPAFVGYQGQAILEVLRREPVGQDDVTDLLFVELKSTDRGAHLWNLFGEEQPHVLRAQDDLMRDLVAVLDERVGAGRYVVGLTADHGLTPLPEEVGGLRIHPDAVAGAVEEHFGPIVEAATPSSLFLDMEAVAEGGIAPAAVARFVGDLRYAQGLPQSVDTASIPETLLRERVFAAAFPGRYVASVREGETARFGPGVYPEGDLTSAAGPGVLPSLGG